ncbi:MAG: hypothetical protein GXY23_08120 [Myxococcales bacterium]|jgi:hypothetical protein|nr:hypothetical protein [Myxococcales bacterium]
MEVFALSFVVVAAVVALLSIGTIFGRRLKGSCGGPDGCACTPDERARCERRDAPIALSRRTPRRKP